MKSLAMALAAGVLIAGSLGCNGLHKLCGGGNCGAGCGDGNCGATCEDGSCGGECSDGSCGGGGHPWLGAGNKAGARPHRHGELVMDPGPAGPPTGAVTYPYYTTRGPRDYFTNNPPSIGN